MTTCLFCKTSLEEDVMKMHICRGRMDFLKREVAPTEEPLYFIRNNVKPLFSLSADDLLSGNPDDDLYDDLF